MPLKPLTLEMTAALGRNQPLVERYNHLLKLSQNESIRDNVTATCYVDDVIKRYKAIDATCPQTEKLIDIKNAYLAQLKQHVAEITVIIFSHPADVSLRLEDVGLSANVINRVTKGMKKSSSETDDVLAGCMLSMATSDISMACLDEHHHHRHHHCNR